MTDEQRWTIYVCPGCGTVTDYDRSTGCGACEDGPMTVPVVVVPVSSVVPIVRLRQFATERRALSSGRTNGGTLVLDALDRLLDDVACASNPTTEDET